VRARGSFVADVQTVELVQPGEGALDDAAEAAESGAVLGLATRDQRFDAERSQLATVEVMVVAAIGDQLPRPSLRPARTCPARAGSHRAARAAGVPSLRFAPVTVQASGIPLPSVSRWYFEPQRPVSTGLGPVVEPFSPECSSRRRPPATSRSHHRRHATPTTTRRAGASTRPRPARRSGAANRSSPSRSQAPSVTAPSRPWSRARTRSPITPFDRRAAGAPD
jgi:hypothetical protein